MTSGDDRSEINSGSVVNASGGLDDKDDLSAESPSFCIGSSRYSSDIPSESGEDSLEVTAGGSVAVERRAWIRWASVSGSGTCSSPERTFAMDGWAAGPSKADVVNSEKES